MGKENIIDYGFEKPDDFSGMHNISKSSGSTDIDMADYKPEPPIHLPKIVIVNPKDVDKFQPNRFIREKL